MDVEIADRADLDRVAALVSLLHRPHLDRVTVTLSGLDATERRHTAELLRRLFNDCGCGAGALAMVVAVAVALLVGPHGGRAIATAALGCLGAAVAGKFLGLARSRRRLLVRLRALRAAH
ncbi:hypothetical protein [Micromonospora mirobrigensis]|uniref:Uncharacterized protein n=1 Tax=Micromonospora mirobrigensis TaxID=262898 RepID=A0A1C5APX5_9ACTN|nr:hypothetical protein [Micromonospora mirobrigensis]SCF47193.1 hypothetical protein GA0070564_11717 [Micromonospora mirobrigensis]